VIWPFLLAAALLSVERLAYAWIWRRPEEFRAWCSRLAIDGIRPVDALRHLFYGFKVLQVAVFAGWCYLYGGRSVRLDAGAGPIAAGAMLIAFGQVLNFAVFYRLGNIGVFYGNRFGHLSLSCRRFPFSVLDHPQYVGAVLSIWGLFLIMRFPHEDWIALPLLETAYYYLGARAEQIPDEVLHG